MQYIIDYVNNILLISLSEPWGENMAFAMVVLKTIRFCLENLERAIALIAGIALVAMGIFIIGSDDMAMIEGHHTFFMALATLDTKIGYPAWGTVLMYYLPVVLGCLFIVSAIQKQPTRKIGRPHNRP